MDFLHELLEMERTLFKEHLIAMRKQCLWWKVRNKESRESFLECFAQQVKVLHASSDFEEALAVESSHQVSKTVFFFHRFAHEDGLVLLMLVPEHCFVKHGTVVCCVNGLDAAESKW